MKKSVIYKILIISILFISVDSLVIGQQTKQSAASLAYAYYNDQEWGKAASLFLKIYEENGVKPYLDNYIRCLIQLKDYSTAEQTLLKKIRKTKDQSFYIDIAYLYEIQGKQRKADDFYLRPMKNFPKTIQSIKTLGGNYLNYLKYEYAQQVFEIGRELLSQPNEFHLEMARVFIMQRNYPAMLDEYFELLIYQPRYLRNVQAQVRSAMTRDVDETLLEATKNKTLLSIQTYPGLDVFNEMLIWVYIQEADYDQAIDLAAALDRRNKETGKRLLDLARTADNAKVHSSAIRAYEILIKKGQVPPASGTRRNNVVKQSTFKIAKQEILTSELALLESEGGLNQDDYKILAGKYEQTTNEIGIDRNNVKLLKELAFINAYRLDDLSNAVSIIDTALQIRNIKPTIKAELILDKADVFLIMDDPWEATFLYAQVEKENKQNPIGALAKFKKAMLAYYTGNFEWAKMQLDVLKGSTSKLIANDAFELSLLIRENQDFEDSLDNGLTALSKADYLYFQKKTDSALVVLDSLINDYPNHSIADDALFREAEIFLDTDQIEKALQILDKINSEYFDGIWGHKALYYLGQIYEGKNEVEKALDYYQKLLDQFPNSFYYLDSRRKIRELKKEVVGTDEET